MDTGRRGYIALMITQIGDTLSTEHQQWASTRSADDTQVLEAAIEDLFRLREHFLNGAPADIPREDAHLIYRVVKLLETRKKGVPDTHLAESLEHAESRLWEFLTQQLGAEATGPRGEFRFQKA